MALQDFLNIINFANASNSDISNIKAGVSDLYAIPGAEIFLEEIVSSGIPILYVVDPNGGDNRYFGVQSINGNSYHVIRWDANDNSLKIDDTGNISYWSAKDIVLHELIHAAKGTDDNESSDYSTSSWDYVGDTVRIEKAIIGSDARASYEAIIDASDVTELGFQIGESLTGGREVGLVVSERRQDAQTDFNFSGRTVDILVIGNVGEDNILAGTGHDFIYGGSGMDILQGNDGGDRIFGNSGSDYLTGGVFEPGFDITTPGTAGYFDNYHSEWEDGKRDFLSGGEGNDTHLVSLDRFFNLGPNSRSQMKYVYDNEADFIDGSDQQFSAYFQFKFDGTAKTVKITAQDLTNLSPITPGSNFYHVGNSVSFDIGGQTVEVQATGELIGTTMFLWIAFPGNEVGAILGGIYNFGLDPSVTKGPDTLKPNPVYPLQDGWLNIDDITTGAVNSPINIDPLSNDEFPNGAEPVVEFTASVVHGSLVADGSAFIYTPNQGFSGVDTYHYNLHNGDVDVETSETALGIILVGDIELVEGTDEADTLSGTASSDALWGKSGDDLLLGADGSDTYIYSTGDGSDYIDDEAGSTADVDVLRFTDIRIADVTFTLDSVNSVTIEVKSTGDVITLDEQSYAANEGWGLERIEFADGVTIDLTHSRDEAWTYNGTGGDDSITGAIWGQKDIFIGGQGDDYLNGEAGSDTYVYSSGDGSDIIDDEAGFTDAGNVDVLLFNDLNASDVSFSRVGADLKIFVTATGDVITVDEQFYSSVENWGIEEIKFADGSVMDRDDILAFV